MTPISYSASPAAVSSSSSFSSSSYSSYSSYPHSTSNNSNANGSDSFPLSTVGSQVGRFSIQSSSSCNYPTLVTPWSRSSGTSSFSSSSAKQPTFERFNALLKDCVFHVLGFLEKSDLRRLRQAASSPVRCQTLIHSDINEACRLICRKENFLPENPPVNFYYTQFLLNRFPNAIGPGVYREYIGEIENVPPIPRKYIEQPRPDCKLVYHPDYITIDVNANSPLWLDETTALGSWRHRARLRDDVPPPGAAPIPGVARKITVPWTLNNKMILMQKYLKKNLPSLFGGMTLWSWQAVMDQNGDIGAPAHWSYQKESLIGFGGSYQSQRQMAKEHGLEIVSLTDRIDFDLSSYLQSGIAPQNINIARTSTLTTDIEGRSRQSTFCWTAFRPSFRLCLNICLDCDNVGAAAGVPPEVQNTGH